MANIFDFKGRVAVITGCSTGLGVQMAKALAGQGCDIVAIARRQNLIDEVAADLEKTYGVKALAIKCDITDTAAVDAAVDEILAKAKQVDGSKDIARVAAISAGADTYVIDADACIGCGACAATCPVGAPVEE